MNEQDALAFAVHNLSLLELERITGLSKSSWQRVRRRLRPPSQGVVKPQSEGSQGVVRGPGSRSVDAISYKNTPSRREGEAESDSASTLEARREAFEKWAVDIHPKQRNFAKAHGLDLEALVLTFRGHVLGTERGLQIKNFGEGFWKFLTSERYKLRADRARTEDFRKRQEEWDKERRERFGQPPPEDPNRAARRSPQFRSPPPRAEVSDDEWRQREREIAQLFVHRGTG